MALERQLLGHGRYRLLSRIGLSRTSEIYLAEDAQLNRQVAVKVVPSRTSPNSGTEIPRLSLKEAKVIGKFSHPHILPLLDYAEDMVNGYPCAYMVMPPCSEGSLLTIADRCRQQNSLLSLQDVAHFVHQAADALQYAHDHKIVHQDVKPANFLIRNNTAHPGQPDLLLADFEIATLNTASPSTGTPMYRAPEQWSNQPVYATDQYALAVMAYQLLTNRFPFQGALEQVKDQHLHSLPQSLSNFNPQVTPALDRVILQALAKRPEQRFPSIKAFAQAFQQADMLNVVSLNQASTPPPASANTASPTTRRGKPTSGITPSLSRISASLLLYAILTAVLGFVAGVFLYAFNKLPGYIVTIISIIWTVLGAGVVAYIGKLVSDGTIGQLWQRARRFRAIAFSILTVGLLTWGMVVLPLPSPPQPFPPGTPTAQPTSTQPNSTAIIASTSQSGPTVTASPTSQPTSNTSASSPPFDSGTVVLDDPLSDNSKGYQWENDPPGQAGGKCEFTGGSYHLVVPEGHGVYCSTNAQSTNSSDFAYQVTANVVQGDSGTVAGIAFRINSKDNSYYQFYLSSYGKYYFQTVINGAAQTIGQDFTSYFHNNQANLIGVRARGDMIDLYVNQCFVKSWIDTNFKSGQIGVIAETGTGGVGVANVVFSDAKVWTGSLDYSQPASCNNP